MPLEIVYHPAQIDFDQPGKHHYQVAFHLDSTWGYSLVPLTVINGLRAGGEMLSTGVAVFGGTHGNEWEGQVAVKRLCHDLDANEMCGRVILMPQLSESACRARSRVSPLDNANMNRAFPGDSRGTISYRIADFVKTQIFPRAGTVIDLHSGGNEGGFPVCTSLHPVSDAAQRAEMETVAKLFDTAFVLIYSSNMASGLLTDEAEADGKITIGGEFGFGGSVDRKGVKHAYEGVKNVLRYYRMLSGEIVKIDSDRAGEPRLMEAAGLEDYVAAPRSGIWEAAVDLGDEIEQRQLLGRLHDFDDHAESPLEIYAHRSGLLLMMHFSAAIEKGTTLYVIAREKLERTISKL
jgi:predicted deacylase